MGETAKFALPLLQPAQAQKHVTVNEALVRLDGMTQLTLMSATEGTPPLGATDGDSYAVPPGAVTVTWSERTPRPAIAARWITPFVDPPIASSTRNAFSTDFAVIMSAGVSPLTPGLRPPVVDGSTALSTTA